MPNFKKRSDTGSTRSAQSSNSIQSAKLTAQERVSNYLLEKLIRWVIAERVDEGKPSWFRWAPEDKKLLSKIIANPEMAGMHLDASDTKYRKFFQSIIDNGLNTADVKMFYRYRDQLPLRKMNWAFDLRDFKHEQGALRSTVKLPAGFYMVELQVRPSRFTSRLPINIYRSDEQLNEPQAIDHQTGDRDVFAMPVISHRMNKRLIWLRAEGFVDLVSDHPDSLKPVTQMRFARTTRSFMIDRMMKKLGQEFKAKQHATMSDEAMEALWERYDQRFGYEYDPVAAYQRFLTSTDKPNLVDRERQLADLTEWLKQPHQ